MLIRRRSALQLVACAIVAGTFAVRPANAKKTETGFLDRTITLSGTIYNYQVFVPGDWTPRKKWPVILFLHGAGERGDDGLKQTQVGIGRAIRLDRSRFPAIIVMPQCRKGLWWTDSAMGDVAMAALAQAQKEFHGDSPRTYLTGLSMGGYGTWYLAGKYPGKFAALAPICGGILEPDLARKQDPQDRTPYSEAARKIGSHTPVWIFHGGDDPVVPVMESRGMNDALKTLGADVRYTEYPGVGHNSWDQAYAESELFSWMLSKSTAGGKSK